MGLKSQHCHQLFCDYMQAILITESPFVISGTPSGRNPVGMDFILCSSDLVKYGVEHFTSAQFLQPCSPTIDTNYLVQYHDVQARDGD